MIDIELVKDIPGYQFIMKALLKSQILSLVEQLAEYAGEETVVMTASVNDGTFCHLGSSEAKDFLEGRDEVKSLFLKHCIKKNMLKKAKEKEKEAETQKDTTFTAMPHPRPTVNTSPRQPEALTPSNSEPTPVRLLKNMSADSHSSGTPGTRLLANSPTIQTKFSIDLKKTSPASITKNTRGKKPGQVEAGVVTNSQFVLIKPKGKQTLSMKPNGQEVKNIPEKRPFTEVQDTEDETFTKKQRSGRGKTMKMPKESAAAVNIEPDVYTSDDATTSNVQECVMDTPVDAEAEVSANSDMTVFVEDGDVMPSLDETSGACATTSTKTGLRKNRKTNGFLQMDSADCASEAEINAAIGGGNEAIPKTDARYLVKFPILFSLAKDTDDEMRVRGTTYRGVTRWFLVPKNSSVGRRRLTNKPLGMKMKILAEVRKGDKKKSEIARHYNLPSSTLSTWVKDADKIEEGCKIFSMKRKCCRMGKWDEIEQILLRWFMKAREIGEPITRHIILEKAKVIASDLNITNFTGSMGWLDRFKQRHGITFRTTGVESMSRTDGCEGSEALQDVTAGDCFTEPEWEVVHDESGAVKLSSITVEDAPQSDVDVILSAMEGYDPSLEATNTLTIKMEPEDEGS